jgi:rod shape-determining protein MreB
METVVLVPEPFAVGYSLGSPDPALIVDIGAGTTDVCHYYGALPTEADQTTIHFGGDHVDELIYQHLLADYPDISISLRTVKNLKEKLGVLDGSQAPIIIRVPAGKQLAKEIDVTQALRAALGKLAEAVYQGICEVLSSIPPEYHSVALSNVILAGGGSQLPGLCGHLEELLHPCGPSNVKRIADSCYAGANGALRLAMELPEDAWVELAKADHLAQSDSDEAFAGVDTVPERELRGAA